MKLGHVAPNGACLRVETMLYKHDAPTARRSDRAEYLLGKFMNIGFVGVGRMGANMARRLKDRSFHCHGGL